MKTNKPTSSAPAVLILFSVSVLASSLIGVAPASAEMGKKSNICGSWNNYCRGGSSGGSSGPSPRARQQQQMNQMMMNSVQGLVGNFMQGFQRGLELNRLRRAGLRLNDAGIAYGRKGNWTAAVNSFRRALQYTNDPVIRRNLARAEEERSGRAEARRRAKRAKLKKIKDMIGNLAKSLDQNGGRPDTAGRRSDANELEFLTPRGNAFFGLGGEAPPPVDARPEPRGPTAEDDKGLAFIPPGGHQGSLGASDPSVVDLRPPTPSGEVKGVQVATADASEGLQFLSPYATPKAAPASGPVSSAGPAKPLAGGYSRKADILLDALRDGQRDWQRSRNILQRRLALAPNDADVRAALADLDAARKLAHGKAPAAPPAPTPGGRKIAQLTSEGRKHIEEGNFAAARDKFLAAWARDPGNEEVTNLAVATKAIVDRDTGVLVADAQQAEAGGDYLTAREKLFQARRLSPADETITVKIKALDDVDPGSARKRVAINRAVPSGTTPPAKGRTGFTASAKAPAQPDSQASIGRIDIPSPPSRPEQALPDSTWKKVKDGTYLGTGIGEDSAQWYADQYIKTGRWRYGAGGLFASLWTPDTYLDTTLTLGPVAVGAAAKTGVAARILPGDTAPVGPGAELAVGAGKLGVPRGAAQGLAPTIRHVYVTADQFSDITRGRDIFRLNVNLLSRPGSKTIFHIKHSDGAITTFGRIVGPRGGNFLESIYDAGRGLPRRVLSNE